MQLVSVTSCCSAAVIYGFPGDNFKISEEKQVEDIYRDIMFLFDKGFYNANYYGVVSAHTSERQERAALALQKAGFASAPFDSVHGQKGNRNCQYHIRIR